MPVSKTSLQYLAAGSLLCLLCGLALRSSTGAMAQQEPNVSQEIYRVRVENRLYGRVDVSLDGGAHYTLIGRVARPATLAIRDNAAPTAGVVARGSAEGLAFAVGANLVMKLRPIRSPALPNPRKAPPARQAVPEPAAILTDIEPKQSLFGDLMPPNGSPVRLQTRSRDFGSFYEGYTPMEEDTYHFLVTAPASGSNVADARAALRPRLESVGHAYTEGAVARARANNRTIASGTLTLRAKLPTGEPDPIVYVTYAVDDDMIATQNVAPFRYAWDTRQASNGEHLVEIRALNAKGRLVTRARALVVVQNLPSSAGAPAPSGSP